MKRRVIVGAAAPALFAGTLMCLQAQSPAPSQPKIETRQAKLLRIGGLTFKDLNRNGKLDPYEDWRLGDEARITDLVSKMTLAEKAALMLHPNIAVPENGVVPRTQAEMAEMIQARQRASGRGTSGEGQTNVAFGFGQMARDAPPPPVYIVDRNLKVILNNGVAPPAVFAKWSNDMQEIAEGTRLGIPILFSTDPRHTNGRLRGHVNGVQYFSQWPDGEGGAGIGASGDPEVARSFGKVVAEEYRAVGLHMILGPALDLFTNPTGSGSFSESPELTAKLIKAFMEGAQGSARPGRALVMNKHYINTGTQKSRTILNAHLVPYAAAVEAGSMAVMCGYGQSGFDKGLNVCYSYDLMTATLRNQLGFQGVVCTDWGVVGRRGPLREDLQGMAVKDQYQMVINAGVDQVGSLSDPTPIVELVKEGRVLEARIDQAAARVLRWHFAVGLFENPYVDPAATAKIVNSEKNRKAGYDAQLKSVILLANDGILPLAQTVQGRKLRIYVSGIDAGSAAQYAEVVADPKSADVALIKVSSSRGGRGFGAPAAGAQGGRGGAGTPAAQAGRGGAGAAGGRGIPGMPGEGGGSIELPDEAMTQIRTVAATGVKTVVSLNGASPVVLPKELFTTAKATLFHVDINDNALLDVIFGKYNPTGRLAFELPSSMEAVRSQDGEVPFDSKDPLFKFGFGLSYPGSRN